MLERELVRRAVETQRQLDSLGKPEVPRKGYVAAWSNVNRAIPSGAWTALIFSGTRWDIGGYWAVANPTRLTVPVGYAGLHVFHGNCVLAANGAGTRRHLAIRINGATYVSQSAFPLDAVNNNPMAIPGQYYLAAGDWAELMVHQDSGVPLNALTNVAQGIEFRMVRTRN